jgi:DinB superfamily
MSQVLIEKPPSTEYAAAFERYVSRVSEADIVGVLARQKDDVLGVFGKVRGAGERYRYAADKWSVREMAGHVVDTERIMGYRAVCVARGEAGSLPGFDENAYVANASFDDVPLGELLEEFAHVREGHLAFFRHLSPEAWLRKGLANGNPISVRALAYVMAGHPRHHLGVVQERYLPHLPA